MVVKATSTWVEVASAEHTVASHLRGRVEAALLLSAPRQRLPSDRLDDITHSIRRLAANLSELLTTGGTANPAEDQLQVS